MKIITGGISHHFLLLHKYSNNSLNIGRVYTIISENCQQKTALFWPWPIVPISCPISIVSAGAFQDSVREGKSWFHPAPKTRTQRSNVLCSEYSLTGEEYSVSIPFWDYTLGLSKYVQSTLSTVKLNPLLDLHWRSIKLVVSEWSNGEVLSWAWLLA